MYTHVGFQTQIASSSVLQFSQFCAFKLLSPTSLLQISLQTTTTTDRFEISSFLDQISAVSLSLISPFYFYISHFNFSLLMSRENRFVFNSKSDFFFSFQFGPHQIGSISLRTTSNRFIFNSKFIYLFIFFFFNLGHIEQVLFPLGQEKARTGSISLRFFFFWSFNFFLQENLSIFIIIMVLFYFGRDSCERLSLVF